MQFVDNVLHSIVIHGFVRFADGTSPQFLSNAEIQIAKSIYSSNAAAQFEVVIQSTVWVVSIIFEPEAINLLKLNLERNTHSKKPTRMRKIQVKIKFMKMHQE